MQPKKSNSRYLPTLTEVFEADTPDPVSSTGIQTARRPPIEREPAEAAAALTRALLPVLESELDASLRRLMASQWAQLQPQLEQLVRAAVEQALRNAGSGPMPPDSAPD